MNKVQKSKFISLLLRHKPEVINLTLDNNGWANVDELLDKLNKSGYDMNFNELKEIVVTNDKQRFTFNEDETKIRANQGHSINVDLELKEEVPPDVLYHGTATRFLDSILEKGLLKQSRNHVHLSSSKDTALNVGKRYGTPVILIIDAKRMYRDGKKFYLSKNGVWLVDYVAPEYIKRN